MLKYITNTDKETKEIAEKLAKDVLKSKKQKAFVVALEGELGSGKTTFLQGFARGLGIREKITSPTFVILKRFKIKNSGFKNFYHIDCYRLQKPRELLDLGFKEIALNPENIIAIEWAERVKKILPKDAIWIKFKFKSERVREFLC